MSSCPATTPRAPMDAPGVGYCSLPHLTERWPEGSWVGGKEWGPLSGVGNFLVCSLLLSCSSKGLYPDSSGYTNPPRKAVISGMLWSRGCFCHKLSFRQLETSIEGPLSEPTEAARAELTIAGQGSSSGWGQCCQNGALSGEFCSCEKVVGVLPAGVGGGR